MNVARTVVRAPAPAKITGCNAASQSSRAATTLLASLALLGASPTAQAVDGCKVLLCLAAPSWRAIPECVPTINQLLSDLARGRAFPICDLSGPGNNSDHRWSAPPEFCPPQYTVILDGPNGPIYRCDYSGAVSINIEGRLWTRTWWNRTGDSVTEYTDAAKQGLGDWDTRFDDDYAAWLAQQPPPNCDSCGD